jgi:hypothetical protein
MPQLPCDERIIQDLLNARTPIDYISAIQDANPADEANIAPQLVVASAGEFVATAAADDTAWRKQLA